MKSFLTICRFKEEKDKYLNQIDSLQNELEILKTQNIEKDRTIEGLQTVIQKQSDLMKKSEIMVKWRNEYHDARREVNYHSTLMTPNNREFLFFEVVFLANVFEDGRYLFQSQTVSQELGLLALSN